MTGMELQERLKSAERSARWLASKLGRSHTQLGRWLTGEQPIPSARANEIRALLVAVPSVTTVEIGALVKPAPGVRGVSPDRRFVVSTARTVVGGRFCQECGLVIASGAVVALDFQGSARSLCLEHVVPINDEEG